MKKLFSLLMIAIFAVSASYAQKSETELLKERQKLEKELSKAADVKLTKVQKKRVKELRNDKWKVMPGVPSLEQQVYASDNIENRIMEDEEGNVVKRFYVHTATSVGGTYNAAYATARSACMNEIAGQIETKLASAIESKLDNVVNSGNSANTVEKYNQRAKAIVQGCLKNAQTVSRMYKEVGKGNYMVSVTLAYDKSEIASNLKKQLKKELETEGDELTGAVDEMIKELGNE